MAASTCIEPQKSRKDRYAMTGKTALVTGGTRGIGAAIAGALKEAGHKVAVSYASDDTFAESFRAETGIAAYKWDVGDYDDCTRGHAAVVKDLGPIEILVNNAGAVAESKFENMTAEQWHKVIRVDLDSVFYMCKLVYPSMMERRWGRIVNIGSMNGQAGQLNQVNYVAAKAGMHGFTKALALEAAKYGITVNNIAPGYVDTYMMREMPERIREKILEKSPVRRFGLPEEVAHAVMFLIDDKAAWSTGATVTLNGGTHMY
jgi:acetoacetyl-CoA reductase